MWFIVALSSFFLIAVTAISDKFLLTKSKLQPISYAFTIGCLSAGAATVLLLFVPDFHFPKGLLLPVWLSGAAFYFAIYFMYLVVTDYEVSKANPIIISLVPIFVFFLSLIGDFESLSFLKILGGIIIIFASFFLSQVGTVKARLPYRGLILAVLSAFMFGIHQIFNKFVYQSDVFLNGFVWIRWSILVTAILYTLVSGNIGKLRLKPKPELKFEPEAKVVKISVKTQFVILIIGQICGAVGTLLQQYAVNLGSVVLVTVLQGTQYLFILLFAVLLTHKFPELFKEDISRAVIKQKIIYSIFLILGVILILYPYGQS